MYGNDLRQHPDEGKTAENVSGNKRVFPILDSMEILVYHKNDLKVMLHYTYNRHTPYHP